jgi:hypothetical protein
VNTAVGPADYAVPGEKYQAAMLEQYKLYMEMADWVSARRNLASTFFLTLNTALATGLFAIANGQFSDISACGCWPPASSFSSPSARPGSLPCTPTGG